MSKYFKNLLNNFIFLLVIIIAALANWQWPLLAWSGDTILYRFLWLGLFFVLLDIFIEIILRSAKEIRLMTEIVGFSKDIHKLSDGFHVLSKVVLPNNLKADYIAVGSSGVWLINVKDGDGPIIFNGDDLIQKDVVLKGLLTKVLEQSYALAEFLKQNLNRDFRIAPVIAFSSPRANLDVPKIVRAVYISSRKDIVPLIENTDIQLIDKNTSDEIHRILRK